MKTNCIFLAIAFNALFGCNKKDPSPPLGPAPANKEAIVIEPAVLQATPRENSKAIVAGEKFTVEGNFRFSDSAEGPPGPMVVKIIKLNASGNPVIQGEGGVKPVKEGNSFSFRGEISAPAKSGNYKLEAWYREKKVGEGQVDVSPR